jgi:hypothetical protein
MHTLALLGWSGETWIAVLAGAALIVSLAGLFVAWRAQSTADSAAEDAKRSATAAERSASAAEERTILHREALEIERTRVSRERLESIKAHGPEWEAAEAGEAGRFTVTNGLMEGALRNVGLAVASVQSAHLDCDGRRAVVLTRCDGPNGGGGWASTVSVPPQGLLSLKCDLEGMPLHGQVRPSLYLDFVQVGADTGQLGATIQLLRQGQTASGKDAWRVGDIRPGVLP